jgi:hypothetical protein
MYLIPEFLALTLAFASLAEVRACGGTSTSQQPEAIRAADGQGGKPQASATPDADQTLELTIKPASEVWDSRKPLVVDLTFKNAGGTSIFLNLKSAFQANGFLEDKDGHTFGIDWTPEGVERMPVKDDYTEIPAGKTLVLTLTSRRISSEGGGKAIPWRAHKPGEYTVYIQFASGSKKYFMPHQWEGTQTSQDVRIKVR